MIKKTVPLLLLITLLLISCQGNEEIKPESVIGKWNRDSPVEGQAGIVYRDELVFSGDGTYEQSLRLLETSNGETVGYKSLLTGHYVLDKNKLYRTGVKLYGLNNQHEWMDRDELVLQSSIDELPVIKVNLNEGGDALTLDYSQNDCPDSGMCVEYSVYYKNSGI